MIKRKFPKVDDLLLLFLLKEIFSISGMAHNDAFFLQIGHKKIILRGFANFFFRTIGLQHKLFTLIDSSDIFHWKSAKKIKVDLGFGAKLGPHRSNVVKKSKKLVFQWLFSYFE